MICIVIKGPSYAEAAQQIAGALLYADLIELRLDLFHGLDREDLKKLRLDCKIPMIFTLRSASQGGSCTLPEEQRLEAIKHLASLEPDYFDIEFFVPPVFIAEIASQYPNLKLILSFHHFSETPDLDALYAKMKKIPAAFYKIAVTARSTLDALRLLCWVKQQPEKPIAISMGSYGQISRILGKIAGSPITYASLDDDQATAPGQLSAKILSERYRYHTLNPDTSIYGLIGDPVHKSISDKTHNFFFHANQLAAVYVKMSVKSSELMEFFQLVKQLPFRGLSVTMPLKEAVMSYMNQFENKTIGAVNTLLLQKEQILGYNTDGIGALNAIEAEISVKGKRIAIIGAGGAAKAIAYEALQRGAFVTLVNRDFQKAYQLALQMHCQALALEQMTLCAKEGYHILINCTPLTMPIAPQDLLPGTLVMDINTKPKESLLLKQALEKGCSILHGYRLFVEQALLQFPIWFNKDVVQIPVHRQLMNDQALACLD